MLFPLTVTDRYDRFGWMPALPKVARYIARSGLYSRAFDQAEVALGERGGRRRLACPSGIAKISLIEVFQNREFDLPTGPIGTRVAERLAQRLQAGGRPLIIDAGANVGATAVYFTLMYPDATVVAVEPQSDNFSSLESNTRALPNVVRKQAALHGEAGCHLDVVQPESRGADAFRTVAASEAGTGLHKLERIGTCTIRSLLDEFPGHFPFILKVDIEGHEKEIFAADPDLLDRFDVIFFEPHDWMLPGEATSQSFLSFLAGHARDFLISGDKIVSVRREAAA